MKHFHAAAAAASIISLAAPAVHAAPTAATAAGQRDGQRDFDWELGTWTTHVKVLRNPLSGEAPDWVAYEGTSIVKPLMAGRANFVELSVKGPAGTIEGGCAPAIQSAVAAVEPELRERSERIVDGSGLWIL